MRRRYTPTCKAHIVRELLKEEKTLAQVAAEHGIHPTQLITWRATALAGLPGLFARHDKRGHAHSGLGGAAGGVVRGDRAALDAGHLAHKEIWSRPCRGMSAGRSSSGKLMHSRSAYRRICLASTGRACITSRVGRRRRRWRSSIASTLNWHGAPAGTASFALEVTDYDAPVACGFHHWIVYNIPANVQTLNGDSPYSQGTNSYGFVGYGGPCPPSTGQVHHYIFTLYALTTTQIAGQALTYDQLIQAISGQVAGATVTIGIFVRS
jgi:Raf kinase inhibitor-like YbhB/YbcL family protein